MSAKRKKMTRDVIPEDFTIWLAFVDLLPVLLFGGTGILLGIILKNALILFGAFLAFLSGALKVLWKMIVVIKRKNIWFLFIQMRVFMPIGLVLLLAGIIFCLCSKSCQGYGKYFISFPQNLFFIFGIAGMGMMGYFATHLDSSDSKSNWIEQITNTISQLCFFLGLLFIYRQII